MNQEMNTQHKNAMELIATEMDMRSAMDMMNSVLTYGLRKCGRVMETGTIMIMKTLMEMDSSMMRTPGGHTHVIKMMNVLKEKRLLLKNA